MDAQDWKQVVFYKTNKETTKNKQTNTSVPQEKDSEIKVAPKISLSNSLLIQKARIAMKLSQSQVANKINIDANTYKKYECGKTNPEYSVLVKLERVLNVKLNKKKTQ